MNYRCILIDDEIRSLDLIENHISKIENWVVAKKYTNPVHALEYLKENTIDVAFVDIQMPQINGLDLIRRLSNSEQVVITTAYNNFGAVAYDLNVIDYLVKPITFERFLQTVKKIETNTLGNQRKTDKILQLKSEGKLVNINLYDILYVEGSKEYVKVHTKIKTFLIHERMHEIETLLPIEFFKRIHKSFIVNKNAVMEFNNEQIVLTNNTTLPISRLKKDEIAVFLKFD
jgi:DNA-binding LytR/AlgR family response regulator